jgi:hypothetical protein
MSECDQGPTRATIIMNTALYTRAQEAAKADDRSFSGIVRVALTAYLASHAQETDVPMR